MPDILTILGYLSSIVIGISLGLIGGGGSILTVPVLVYLFHADPVVSTSYSLFIVGITSLLGAFPKFRDDLVDLRTAIVFGIPSILSVYITRYYVVPAIPDPVMETGGFVLSKGGMMMLVFSLLMIASAVSMIRTPGVRRDAVPRKDRKYNYPVIFAEGLLVGMLTGLVGAGGGFLIIPALVLICGLPMKEAVGTSLLIIAAKSLIGFLGDAGQYTLNWELLLAVTLAASVGIFIGNHLSKKINGEKLKKGFGWFVLLTGLFIIWKEIK